MCGFAAVVADQPVAPSLLLAMQAIQHRGQDQAGLGTFDGRRVHLVKGDGMIDQAVPAAQRASLVGHAGVGHVRYPTAGSVVTSEDAQPFRTRHPGVLLAHNGNVTNTGELTQWLADEGWVVQSGCDAEPILLVFARALMARRPSGHTQADVAEAVRDVFRRVRGAYSVTAVLEVDGQPTLVAFRDPHGIRPGCYGRRADGAWMAASESVALDVLDFEREGELPAGGLLLLRHGAEPILEDLVEPDPRPCVFERIYFARPDSVMDGDRVNRTRWLMGRQLAREWAARSLHADWVIPIPDSSRPAAMAMSEELGIRYREGFIKNRYSGRTFIMPDQTTRDEALRLKLNPIREMFEGQQVLLVDDSIVRGSTMRHIIQHLRRLKPAALHLAIFSPPVAHPCFYGIDMPTRDELLASRYAPGELDGALAAHFDADTVTYLSVDGMRTAAGHTPCDACFTGQYCVPVSAHERGDLEAARRARG
ncbi:MAG: amidophosphoribosyltransferase [Alphaproteobacteria bacterium]|nr:amidophosphoribosyltransferase [Alphaproteobacteria bacterium]